MRTPTRRFRSLCCCARSESGHAAVAVRTPYEAVLPNGGESSLRLGQMPGWGVVQGSRLGLPIFLTPSETRIAMSLLQAYGRAFQPTRPQVVCSMGIRH